MRMPIIAGLAALLGTTAAIAQGFPSKPLRFIIAYAPGGGADVLGRLLAQRMTESLGQQVAVESRPGAGGTIAASAVAKSPPDGHVLYFSDAAFVTAPGIYQKLPYDPLADFTPVARAALLPLALVAHPSLPVTDPRGLVALMKRSADRLSYGSPGVGTLHHLATELLKKQTGGRMVHVPYKGAAPLLTDLMGGQIPLAMTSATAALAQVKSGRMRIVGVSSAQRMANAPEVPALAEAVPGFDVSNELFVLGPAGLPRAVVDVLSAAMKAALEQTALREAYLAQGAIVAWTSSEELGKRIGADIARWRAVAKDAGIRPE